MVSRGVEKRLTLTLFVSQSLFSSSTIMSFTLMPVISAHLGGSDSVAGVPPTLTLLGRAVAAYPVGWLMDRIGRRLGLTLGYILATIGAALCVLAITHWESFVGFSAGGFLMGMGRGVTEQIRFVAAEIVLPDKQAQKIGLMVLAGTVGAVGGPLLVDPSGQLGASFGLHAHAGPYLMAGVFTLLGMVLVFTLLKPDPMEIGQSLAKEQNEAVGEARALRVIFADRTVRLGIGSMVIGQLVMTLIMVITPLHMDHHAHSVKDISWVIMAHTVGMYGLSSITGRLVNRFGRVSIVITGAIILAVSAVLTPISNEMPLLTFALFLLGLGWNFCFIAGSSLLSEALASVERGRVQGASEMLVALAAGAGSLGTGIVFAGSGIVAVSAIGLAFSLALFGGTTSWQRKEDTIMAGERD
jgi:MFS family permease